MACKKYKKLVDSFLVTYLLNWGWNIFEEVSVSKVAYCEKLSQQLAAFCTTIDFISQQGQYTFDLVKQVHKNLYWKRLLKEALAHNYDVVKDFNASPARIYCNKFPFCRNRKLKNRGKVSAVIKLQERVERPDWAFFVLSVCFFLIPEGW